MTATHQGLKYRYRYYINRMGRLKTLEQSRIETLHCSVSMSLSHNLGSEQSMVFYRRIFVCAKLFSIIVHSIHPTFSNKDLLLYQNSNNQSIYNWSFIAKLGRVLIFHVSSCFPFHLKLLHIYICRYKACFLHEHFSCGFLTCLSL